jgi:HlyD family secretion protein
MRFFSEWFFAALRWLKSHWILTLLALILLSGGAFWQYRRTQAAKPSHTFVKPERGDLTKTLQVSGVIDAKEKALLRFAAGGKVVYLGAKTGEWVKKGQTIAAIDRKELEKRLQKDLNAYMTERWDWENLQDDTDYHVETLKKRRAIDQDQWDLNDTVLDVEIRDIAIRNTVISAPFAGVLVSSPTEVTGVQMLASEGFEVVNPATLVFKGRVDEADIGLVKQGQTAEVVLDAHPDEPFHTNVASIDFKSSTTTTGTVFLVEVPIATSDGLGFVRLGMNGDVTITVDTRHDVLHIPLDATRERDGKTYVDVRTGLDTVAEKEIEVDLTTDDRVEVISGLKLDDEIVLP